MSNLFGKTPEPEAPATMPDAEDPAAKRAKRYVPTGGGRASTRLEKSGGTMGKEYSRGTLG